jgi:hypothetical protein
MTGRGLIAKILEPEVWLCWQHVSRGGAIANAHLVDQLGEKWNPVARDNNSKSVTSPRFSASAYTI